MRTAKISILIGLGLSLSSQLVAMNQHFEFGDDCSSYQQDDLLFELEPGKKSNMLEVINEDYSMLVEKITEYAEKASLNCIAAAEVEFKKYVSESTNRFHVRYIVEAGNSEFNKFFDQLESHGVSIALKNEIKSKIYYLKEKHLGSWGFVTIKDAFEAMKKLSAAVPDAVREIATRQMLSQGI